MGPNQNFIIIYITYKDMTEAKKVAEALLRDHLIACVNYFPIESAYWWPTSATLRPGEKGKVEKCKEIVSLIKTRTENWDKVRTAVEALHPYEVPCIMKLDVTANESYVNWIYKETE